MQIEKVQYYHLQAKNKKKEGWREWEMLLVDSSQVKADFGSHLVLSTLYRRCKG